MTLSRLFPVLCLLLPLSGCGIFGADEPAFESVTQDKAFEIRDYPPLVVAQVKVQGDQKEAGNRGFRKLAGYIFGGNKRADKIAMTAPVSQVPTTPVAESGDTSEKIAMTAPVAQVEQADGWLVRFTMPPGYTLENLPVPDDADVKLIEMPAARFAVLKFSGNAREMDVQARKRELLSMTQERNLSVIGEVTLAQYNPPWIPGFFRRNEVMVEISSGE
ncbi:MAG: heme-binding protein [Burkholderiaceae bacterium]